MNQRTGPENHRSTSSAIRAGAWTLAHCRWVMAIVLRPVIRGLYHLYFGEKLDHDDEFFQRPRLTMPGAPPSPPSFVHPRMNGPGSTERTSLPTAKVVSESDQAGDEDGSGGHAQ